MTSAATSEAPAAPSARSAADAATSVDSANTGMGSTYRYAALARRRGDGWGVNPETGERYIAAGEYREITPPQRLVYTHSWETDQQIETLITVELHEEGDSTRLVMVQDGFITMGSRDGHTEGWSSAFDLLQKLLEGQSEGA